VYEQFVAPGLKQAGAEARKVPQIKLFLEKVDAFTVRRQSLAQSRCFTQCVTGGVSGSLDHAASKT
jgi:hypothetical protein